jgi:ABC-type nitrate/sulfonate/bicarbonate transport system substrate-binding protein
MKWKSLALCLIVGALFGTLAIFWLGRNTPDEAPGQVEKIRLGVPTVGSSSLIYFAEKKGFFRDNGLDASIINYESGAAAISGLLSGEIDIAAASEFVLVRNAFDRRDLRVLASVSVTDTMELIMRNDSGVKNPGDLKGKKIATVRGSNLDYFLTTFLTSNGISPEEVQLVNLPPSETGEALSRGLIDGAATVAPYTFEYKSRLRAEPVTFAIQGGQDSYLLLIALNASAAPHSALIKKVMKALIKAEEYAQKNEAEAQKIVRDRLNVNQSYIDSIWPKGRFEIRLDQDLLILMEHEARWAIRNKLTESTGIPNYFALMDVDTLKKLRPEAVTVIQ